MVIYLTKNFVECSWRFSLSYKWIFLILDATGNQEWTFFTFVHLCVHEEHKEIKQQFGISFFSSKNAFM